MTTDIEALDAYSRVVVSVAEKLGPSVANLRVSRRGTGSGVVITPDGFMLTNAHVIGKGRRVRASFTDGSDLQASVVGIDPLSDLGLLRLDAPAAPAAPNSGTRRSCASASSSSRSATRTATPGR